MQGYNSFLQKIRPLARDNVQIPALVVFKVLAMSDKCYDCLTIERNAAWKDLSNFGQNPCQITEEKVRINDGFKHRPICADWSGKADSKLM